MNQPMDLERLAQALIGTSLLKPEAPHTFAIVREQIGTRRFGPPPSPSDFVKPLPLASFGRAAR